MNQDFLKAEAVGLIATTFRSGSQWLFYSFKDAYQDVCRVHHEAPIEVMVDFPGIDIGFTVAQWAPELRKWYGPELPLVHITRDPIAVAQSAHRRGYKRWDLALENWVILHKRILEAAPDYHYRIEDIWEEPSLLHEIAEAFGLEHRDGLLHYAGVKIGDSKGADVSIKLTSEAEALRKLFGYE